ncbi:MAG: N-6 DNA methylase [Candidatus Woesearchaeota archaeon]
MYLIETTKDLVELSLAEISSYFEIENHEKNYVIVKSNESILKDFEKLGFAKNLYLIIFSFNAEQFIEKLKQEPTIKNQIPNNFFISTLDEKNKKDYEEIKKNIGLALEDNHHKIDFKGIPLYVIRINNKLYLLKKIKKANLDYNNFRNSIVPLNSATLLDTKLAKAMLNLAKIEKDDVILDPFCGAGGILIEASKLNVKVFGNDLFHVQLRKAGMNLIWFRCKNVKLVCSNAKDCEKLAEIIKPTKIVTDLPYGLRSKLREEIKILITSILKLRLRSVLLCIDNQEIDQFIKKTCNELNLILENEFNIPVNHFFRRKLYVIKPN